jgi:hypothetical protein
VEDFPAICTSCPFLTRQPNKMSGLAVSVSAALRSQQPKGNLIGVRVYGLGASSTSPPDNPLEVGMNNLEQTEQIPDWHSEAGTSPMSAGTGTFKRAVKELAFKRGIPVIPLPPREKGAKLTDWPSLATTDKEQLTIWLNENPSYNAGAVAKPDGVWILDCDDPTVPAQIEADTGRKIPRTFTVKASKAPHFYWKQGDGSRAMGNLKAAGRFDCQVNDKYVVAPYSIHPGGIEYAIIDDSEIVEAPDWLIAWLLSHADAPKKTNVKAGGSPVSDEFDFCDFVDFYELGGHQSGDWFVTDVCPVSQRKHEQSVRTGFFWDGSSLGFHCFASGCAGSGMRIGEVIRHLNEQKGQSYRGVIWEEPPDKFEIEDADEIIDSITPEASQAEDPAAFLNTNPEPDVQARPPEDMSLLTEDELLEKSLYGWLGEQARMMQSPLGPAYSVLIVRFMGQGVPPAGFTRPTGYLCLKADKGAGKSRIVDRSESVFRLKEGTVYSSMTLASDRGVSTLGGRKKKDKEEDDDGLPPIAMPTLVVQDELKTTLGKMAIRNSGLAGILCTLFYKDEAGSLDKQGRHAACCKLSLIGGLKARDPHQFSEAFGRETDDGLYDRFLFDEVPDGWDFDDNWEIQREELEVPVRFPKRVRFPLSVIRMKDEWKKRKPGRSGRLAEYAKRIALTLASANHDEEVSEGCMRCALHYVERQERIRERLVTGQARTIDAECWGALESILRFPKPEYVRTKPDGNQYVHWRTMCQKHNLHREFGKMVGQVKRAMLEEHILLPLVVADEDGKKTKDETWVRLR